MRLDLVVGRTCLEMRLQLVVGRTRLEVRLDLVVRRTRLEMRLDLVMRRASLQMRVPLGVDRRRIAGADIVAVLVVGAVEIADDPHQAGIEQAERFVIEFAGRVETAIGLQLRQRRLGLRAHNAVDRARVVAQKRERDLDGLHVDTAVLTVEPLDADAIGQDVGAISGRNGELEREFRRFADTERHARIVALDARVELETVPAGSDHVDERRRLGFDHVPQIDRTGEIGRTVICQLDGEAAFRTRQTFGRTALVDVEIVALRLRQGRFSGRRGARAGAIDFHVADLGGVVLERLDGDRVAGLVDIGVEIDHVGGEHGVGGIGIAGCRIGAERGLGQHLVERLHGRALEAVHLGNVVAFAGRGLQTGPVGRAQRIAGGPDAAIRPFRVDRAVGGITVTEIDTAGGIGADMRRAKRFAVIKADVVAAERDPEPLARQRVLQHARGMRRGKGLRLVEAEIAHPATFADQHHAFAGDGKVGHRAWRCVIAAEFRQHDFAAHIGTVEAAVFVQADRPHAVGGVVAGAVPFGIAHAVRARHGIIEPGFVRQRVSEHRQAEHAAAEIGIVPACGRLREGLGRPAGIRAVADRRARGRIEGDRGKRRGLAGNGVEEAGARVGAMVETIDLRAVERQAVDHAGFEVGDEQLPVRLVEGDIAEAGAGVLASVQRDDGKQFGLVVIVGVEPVEAAGAAFAPLSGQPIRVVGIAMQAELRGGRQVDIGRTAVIDGNAEDLADLAGGHRQALRLVDPVATVGGKAGIAHVNDGADQTALVDQGQALAVGEGDFGGAGKACGKGLSGRQRLLRKGGRHQRGRTQKQGRGKGEAFLVQGAA